MMKTAFVMAASVMFSVAVFISQPDQLPGRTVSADEAGAVMGASCFKIVSGTQTVCSEACGFDIINNYTSDMYDYFKAVMCTNVSTCTAPKPRSGHCGLST